MAMSAAMTMSDSLLHVSDVKPGVKIQFTTPSTVASDLDTDIPQLDLDAQTKISHYDHAFPVSTLHPEPETQSRLNLTWDQAFLPPVRAAAELLEPTKASIAAAWEKAFGVPRPRNDLMHAVLSSNSKPMTTWDAAFQANVPVARHPETPAPEMPTWDRVFRVS